MTGAAMTQKMILAIVHTDDADAVQDALRTHNYPATRLGSIGGFLREGSVTFLVGVAESLVPDVLAEIRAACDPEPLPDRHRATLFVVPAGFFEQL